MDPTHGRQEVMGEMWKKATTSHHTVTATPQPQGHTHPHFSGGCPGKSPIPSLHPRPPPPPLLYHSGIILQSTELVPPTPQPTHLTTSLAGIFTVLSSWKKRRHV